MYYKSRELGKVCAVCSRSFAPCSDLLLLLLTLLFGRL